MSKARVLADFISDGSTFADGAIDVAEVSGAAPLASPTFTGNVDLGDNVQIRLGNDNDLRLYHDNATGNSYIWEQGTGGELWVLGTDIRFANTNFSSNYARFVDGGEVELYYGNQVKLETATDGVDITGDVGATTATITGKTTTDELDLNAIAATISDTAVDIFVYDTRKDSDGGAWRKRTQHTSWYNETLNTSTRGSRKEFPAVAVIVVDNNGLYIYDGDDPDLPMWMKANDVASGMVLNISNSNAVTAKNGIIALAGSSALWVMHFVDDRGDLRNAARRYDYKGNIEQRNDGLGYIDQETSGALASATVNDVAMTVLPNAPIDAATGLPVPTIAVATDGGVSVIKDDGTVVDGVYTGGNSDSHTIALKSDGTIAWTHENGPYFLGKLWEADWSQGTGVNVKPKIDGAMFYPAASGDYLSSVGLNTTCTINAAGSSSGLTKVDVPSGSDASVNGMVNFITSDYNTGWMNGDIKLATLADTDATNVTGSELVTNGTFASDTAWTKGTGWSITGGQAVGVCSTAGTASWLEQDITTVVGEKYVLSFELVAKSGLNNNEARVLVPSQVIDIGNYAVGYHAIQFTADNTTSNIQIGFSTVADNGDSLTVDNVSVRLAEEDRSVNGNGLQVFGTVTKSAVATGADLVAYSGFSSGNYLEQPVNSDLTGSYDSCFMGWMKTSSTSQYQYIFSLGSSSSDVFGLAVQITTGYLYAYDDVNSLDASSTNVADGSWHHVCLAHKNGVNKQLYVDGRLVTTFTTSSYTHSNDVKYRAGQYYTANYAWLGSLALQRFSKTIPSPEQIKKIYEDEKVLFQDNAQATLYGSSDAVTALAYDDSTNLLHVGTSAGRSVFQGLKRVDNTTTAVGAAISASNGLVADE